MSRGQSFLKGALILSAAGLGVRLMGAGLKIFLAAVMGDEGIGLYQMAYPVYTTLLAISTAGIPIAVSKLVAESLAQKDFRGAYRVFKVALAILTILGSVFTLLLLLGANFFASSIAQDPRAYYPLIGISPAIFLVTIMSVFRGFFQGQQEMMPTASSQIVEQAARIVVVIVLVYLLLPRGLEFAAAGAAFGAVAGALFSLLFLLFLFFRSRKAFLGKIERQIILKDFSWQQVLYRIFALSIPITLGSLVLPLINLLDLSIVPLRLHQAGFSTVEATSLYGQLTGMANSVIQFPVLLTIALAMSLVPAISEAQALRSTTLIRERTGLALRVTLFFAIPASLGLFILAEPTTLVLFDNVGASYPLAVLSFAVVFLSLYTATSGILQGLGRTLDPVKNMVFGAAIKFVLSWILTAMPALHIGGAAFSTVAGFSVAAFFNIRQVSVLTGWRFSFGDLLVKPLVAAFFMSWGVLLTSGLLGPFLGSLVPGRLAGGLLLIIEILLGLVIYVLVLILIGGLTEADLKAVPRLGNPLSRWVRRFKLIRK
ncbi:MAG TPA: polysaccharide biosynthesis protein [Firmicutes bacterium]|nr:polysaccharide biosynthesis protein [Bacillota bacterium]